MRITFLIGSLEVGGAETQLVRLVNALDRDRFRPSILYFYGGGPLELDLAPDVRITSVSPHRVPDRGVHSKALLGLRLLWTIGIGLRRERPDVLHAYLPVSYVLGGIAAWLLHVRVIIGSRRGLTSYQDIYPYRVIDLHLCNSESVRTYALEREGLDRTRTAVIYNGIDLPPLGPVPELPDSWRPPGTTVLAGVVANLIPYKDHRTLLEAVAQVACDLPGFRLLLIGDGPERGALEAQVHRLGITSRVVFAGRRLHAAELIPAFDFTILASTQEGFPNAVMESMAHAVPVVATAAGGIRELIEDGVTGILVAPRDAKAMADGIRRMAADPEGRRRMGDASRRRIAEQFGVRRMVDATEAVYQRLTSGGTVQERAD
jgi:glycosyltransferase involved in cell wall biosynthesis